LLPICPQQGVGALAGSNKVLGLLLAATVEWNAKPQNCEADAQEY